MRVKEPEAYIGIKNGTTTRQDVPEAQRQGSQHILLLHRQHDADNSTRRPRKENGTSIRGQLCLSVHDEYGTSREPFGLSRSFAVFPSSHLSHCQLLLDKRRAPSNAATSRLIWGGR